MMWITAVSLRNSPVLLPEVVVDIPQLHKGLQLYKGNLCRLRTQARCIVILTVFPTGYPQALDNYPKQDKTVGYQQGYESVRVRPPSTIMLVPLM